MPDKYLISIPDFIAQFSISRTALYREVKANRLRLVKRGRRSFVNREDAQTWLTKLPTVGGVEHAA